MKEQNKDIRNHENMEETGKKTEENAGEKRSFGKLIRENARNCLKDIHKKDILILILCSLAVNFVIETLALVKYDGICGALMKLLPDFGNVSGASDSVFVGFMSLFTHPLKVFNDPLVFLYNSAIIMVVLSLSMLFKKRYFAMTVLSVVWIGFGIANFVILSYRVTPFSVVELKLIDAAVGVMKSYVTGGVFFAVAVLVLVAAAALVFVWVKTPKFHKINRFSSVIIIAGTFLLVFASTFAGLRGGVIAETLPNLSVNYQEYGFVYCFVSSFKTGIGKPKGYSEEKVKEIQTETKQKLENSTPAGVEADNATQKPAVSIVTNPAIDTTVDDSKLPNVIFLQLESFFDITAMEGLELSEDPIPTFRRCMQEYSSGYLSVPSVGAGTANTEFEIMTGMNLDFFGPGEYPYKTILKNQSCETTAYNLKNHGFTAQAIHNNRANFYGRNSVFRRMGYDIFTSVELMNVQEYTENGWAKDKILTQEIIDSLSYTEKQDYIYTISVQGHGEYPDTVPVSEPPITVKAGISNESNKYRVQYYVNQIKEMDTFLSELIAALEAFGEDTVLIVYGDHLPNLDISEEKLSNKNMFQTQYFIWNNCGLDVVKEDIEAYQLSAKVLGAIGVKDGAVNAYHQANWELKDTQAYQDNLEILGYDMLYGDNAATGGENVYEPTKLQYGVKNVEVSSVYRDQSDTDYLMIKGNYFTRYSAVFINGEKVSAKFVDENTLRVNLEKQTEDIHVVVKQSYKGKLILQTSNEVIYEAVNEEDVYHDGDTQQEEEIVDEDFAGLLEEEMSVMDEQEIDDEQMLQED